MRLLRVIRRATALLLGSFLLVLNVERADQSCARHSTAAMAPHAGMQHHADASGHSSGNGTEDCPAPAQSDCCSALATCSMTMAFERVMSSESIALRHDDVAQRPVITPHSRIRAPEPPPPRA